MTQNSYLKVIEENLQEGLYIVDFEANLVYANGRLAEILGYASEEEILGLNVLDFVSSDYHEQICDLFAETISSKALKKNIVFKIDKKNGDKNLIQLNLGGINHLGIIGSLRELPEGEEACSNTSHSGALYKTIVELSPDAIMICSLDVQILDINNAAINLYECNDKFDAVGHSVLEFIDPDEIEHLRTVFEETILSDYTLRAEAKLVTKRGKPFIGKISAKRIPANNKFGFVIVVLSRDITEQRLKEHNLEAQATIDPLTNLLNRRGFQNLADQEIKHAQRRRMNAVLVFIDIDKMKFINDLYGHESGDQAIQIVATALKTSFRNSDLLSRWGGDEFLVLALDTEVEHAANMIEKINWHLQKIVEEKDIPYEVYVSAGCSHCDLQGGFELHKAILLADMNMYKEKVFKKKRISD